MEDYTPLKRRLLPLARNLDELSRKTCVDKGVLSRLMCGTYPYTPRLQTWHKIAKAAKCPVDELLELHGRTKGRPIKRPGLSENRTVQATR